MADGKNFKKLYENLWENWVHRYHLKLNIIFLKCTLYILRLGYLYIYAFEYAEYLRKNRIKINLNLKYFENTLEYRVRQRGCSLNHSARTLPDRANQKKKSKFFESFFLVLTKLTLRRHKLGPSCGKLRTSLVC